MTNKDREEVERILSSLYYRGVHDGIDIGMKPNDRFLGNNSERQKWEIEQIQNKADNIQSLITQTEERVIERVKNLYDKKLKKDITFDPQLHIKCFLTDVFNSITKEEE